MKKFSMPLRKFATAGKATFTVRNNASGARFTYCVKQSKCEGDVQRLRFVYAMVGSDNEHSYKYLGTLFPETGGFVFRQTKGSKIAPAAPIALAFAWIWRNVDRIDDGTLNNVEVFHANKCCKCGRKLTVPESVESGIGPECTKQFYEKL